MLRIISFSDLAPGSLAYSLANVLSTSYVTSPPPNSTSLIPNLLSVSALLSLSNSLGVLPWPVGSASALSLPVSLEVNSAARFGVPYSTSFKFGIATFFFLPVLGSIFIMDLAMLTVCSELATPIALPSNSLLPVLVARVP